MPSPPLKSLPPRQLVLVGIIALVAAGAIVANGLIGRSRNHHELVEWTNAQAVPTVTLAKLTRGDAEHRLILPGDIQPCGRATVYSP
jgi:hypothetical protein